MSPRRTAPRSTYGGKNYTKFVYNDGDGSTGYDVVLSAAAHVDGPRVPRAAPGRSAAAVREHEGHLPDDQRPRLSRYGQSRRRCRRPRTNVATTSLNNGTQSQPVSALITAVKGERILLRLSNLNVTNYYTVTAQGLPMKVVGAGRAPAARAGRHGSVLRHHLGDARRRRVGGSDDRHADRAWRREPTSSTPRT